MAQPPDDLPMNENDDFKEPEEAEIAPDVEINLETPDEIAYEELVDQFGKELIDGDIQEVVKERIRSLYDNQEQIEQRIAQAKQQAAQAQR